MVTTCLLAEKEFRAIVPAATSAAADYVQCTGCFVSIAALLSAGFLAEAAS